jgi:hypothetical protein
MRIGEKYCGACGRGFECLRAYRKTAGPEGGAVSRSAVAAFLAPLLVFIASAAAVEKVLGGVSVDAGCRGAVAFLFGAAAASLWVLAFGFMRRL